MNRESVHIIHALGVLGNVVSFMVFLSPVPTFYRAYKTKSTAGFQSIVPYVVELFRHMLWIYNALLKDNTTLIIIVNSMGCFIQTCYICFFLIYAPEKARIETLKLIGLMIVVEFGLIVSPTHYLASGANRRVIVEWICLILDLSVFIPPFCTVKQIIKTKCGELIPILPSMALTLNAVTWFFYALLLHDFKFAIPNALGFTFGVLQMIIFFVYKNKKPVCNENPTTLDIKNIVTEEPKIPANKGQETIDVMNPSTSV